MLLNDIKQSNFEEAKTIPFESKKFGVGISTLTVNYAIFLSDLGYRAIAIESGLGGSNLRCFRGFQNQHPVVGVILKAKKGHLSDNFLPLLECVGKLMSNAGKTPFMAKTGKAQKTNLSSRIKNTYADFIMLDLNAGSAFNTMEFFALGKCGIEITTLSYPALQGVPNFLKQHLLRIIQSTGVAFRRISLSLKVTFKNKIGRQFPLSLNLCQFFKTA